MKTQNEKAAAIELRKQGMSYNEIRKQVRVSKNTLSRWLRDVPLTEDQLTKLKSRSNSSGGEPSVAKKIRDYWKGKRERIKGDYRPPIEDAAFTFGLGLYWGEGTKWSPAAVALTNSDSGLLKQFVLWVQRYFADDFERMSVSLIHHFPERDQEIKQYWSDQLGIGVECFIKSIHRLPVSSKNRKGQVLPYGTARVTLCGRGVWKIRQKIEKSLEIVSI